MATAAPLKQATTALCTLRHLAVRDWGILPPETALCREAALLRRPLPNTAVLSFWRPAAPTLVLGKGLDPQRELLPEASGRLRLLVRSSGGGAIYLPDGSDGAVLCVGLVLPFAGGDFKTLPILKVHELGGRILSGAFQSLGAASSLQGAGDVAAGGRKLAGSAQCRRRNAILYHACVLLKAPIGGMERFLRPPSRAPEYRQGRRHRDFVTDLGTLTARPPRELGAVLPPLIAASAARVLGL